MMGMILVPPCNREREREGETDSTTQLDPILLSSSNSLLAWVRYVLKIYVSNALLEQRNDRPPVGEVKHGKNKRKKVS